MMDTGAPEEPMHQPGPHSEEVIIREPHGRHGTVIGTSPKPEKPEVELPEQAQTEEERMADWTKHGAKPERLPGKRVDKGYESVTPLEVETNEYHESHPDDDE